MKILILSLLTLLVCDITAHASDFGVTHKVVGTPAMVEVIDTMNPQAKKRFYLDRGQSNSVSVTGTKVKVRVYEKGTGRLRVEGEFPARSSIVIEAMGTRWSLRKVR